MVDLCKYKNIFGKPNEGFHSYRIFKSLEEACKAINEMEKQYEDEF